MARVTDPPEYVDPEDMARAMAIPQEEIDTAALKCIMFATDKHGSAIYDMLKFCYQYSEELCDLHGIYGNERSNASLFRFAVSQRVEKALRELLDEQKQKHP